MWISLHTKLHHLSRFRFLCFRDLPAAFRPDSLATGASATERSCLSSNLDRLERAFLFPSKLPQVAPSLRTLRSPSSPPVCVSSVVRAPSLKFPPVAASPTARMARCALLVPHRTALDLQAFQTCLSPKLRIQVSTLLATCAASTPSASAPNWCSRRPRRTSSSTSLST
jgi:hypothetical protein